MCPVVVFGYSFIRSQRPAGRPVTLLCRPRLVYYSRWPSWKEGRTPPHRPAGERGFVCGGRRSGARTVGTIKTRRQPAVCGFAVRARSISPVRPWAERHRRRRRYPSRLEVTASPRRGYSAAAAYSWRTEIIMCSPGRNETCDFVGWWAEGARRWLFMAKNNNNNKPHKDTDARKIERNNKRAVGGSGKTLEEEEENACRSRRNEFEKNQTDHKTTTDTMLS